MRILITGASGMLGKELPALLAPCHKVLAATHADCEISDPSAVERYWAAQRPNVVINCAAMSDVDGCESDPQRAMAINACGPGYMAAAAERIGARLVHISTDYVFDGQASVPYTEQDATCPVSQYGRSKLEGEHQVLQAGSRHSPHLVIRTSWLYGRYRTNFVDGTVESARAGRPIVAVAEQVSCPTWTYALAERIAALVERDARGILHLAGSGECSRYEMACYIVDKLGSSVPITATSWAKLNRPARRPLYSAVRSVRLTELGINALPDWKNSLDAYLRLRFGIS